MAAPNSSSSYKTNVGRSVTKKWREANQISYDGDDWGDDDEYEESIPVSAGSGSHQRWDPPPNVYSSNRSVTNPSPSRVGARASFDRGDDRRAFSSSAGFDSAYSISQRSPFPEPQHDFEPSSPNVRGTPPLHVNTHSQGSMPPGNFRPSSRGRQFPSYDPAFSPPGGFPQQRRSGSSSRPHPADIFQRHESPMRPDSRGSSASVRQFPLRKASLSRQIPPQLDFVQAGEAVAPAHFTDSNDNNEDKPVPVFVRPSDIYKRMAEESEKVRKSQESARPSMESISGRAREGSVGARSTSSDTKDINHAIPQPVDEPESTRRLKPTLDPVPERKSEYGFDNILKTSEATNPSVRTTADEGAASVSRHPTTASSVYTDRPDPVSAASANVSSETIPEVEVQQSSPVRPTFALPAIGRVSGFGMDFGVPPPGTETETHPSHARPGSHIGAESGPAGEETNIEPDSQGLQHQPSFGYRSIVQQAFDESQTQASMSPVSPPDTVGRSNSASTSDISPIITRRQEPSSTVSDFEPAYPSIPEEPLRSDSRPTSTSTLKPTDTPAVEDEDFPSSGPIRAGYRRDVTPPSRDNSPAKRPISRDAPADPRPQHGVAVFEQEEELVAETDAHGRLLEDKPLPAAPVIDFDDQTQSAGPGVSASESISSEVEQEWQAQREKFHSQTGSQDSSREPLDIPSPMKRSETPAKGTVRDLAGKLETLSGRSTPSNVQASSPPAEQGRPPPQSRLESFRPSIPGGWQSFSSATGPASPAPASTPLQHSTEPPLQPRPPFAPMHAESWESIPTAKAPQYHASEKDSITLRAFAAAASAGSALAESLTAPLTGQRSTVEDAQTSGEASDDSSENEWDASSTSSKQEADPAPLNSPPRQQRQEDELEDAAQHSVASTPAHQASGNHSSSESQSMTGSSAKQHEQDEGQTDDDSYFPAPLRTSRLSAPASRPPIPEVSVPEESLSNSDNDRLQLEIEKSLTPKSSRLDGSNEPQPVQTDQVEKTFTTGEASNFAEPDIDFQGIQSGNRPLTERGPANMPHKGTDLADTTHLPPQVDEQHPSMASRPFLQQRFSWETQTEQSPSISTPKQTSPPPTGSPGTIRTTSHLEPTPDDTHTADKVLRDGFEPDSSNQAQPPLPPQPSTLSNTDIPPIQTSRQSQPEPVSVRAIMGLDTPHERIRAYDESRRVLAIPDGHLQEWLLSLRTAEHSELFAMNGCISQDTADTTNSHKPSPRRIFTESTGARHMQEDGKKLMAAAGRFGGKAGVAAKGLFAKGKEKMRHASSGEKGFLGNRRKSAGPEPDSEPEDAHASSQARESTFLGDPPQIALSISPVASSDWFARPEFQRSQTNDLRGPEQSEGTALSTVSVNPEANEAQQKEQPETEGHSNGIAVVVPPVVPSSLTASAPDSEHPEDHVSSSRPISQLTGPTAEYSPSEQPQAGIAEQATGPEPDLLRPQDFAGPQTNVGSNALAAPDLLAGQHGVPDLEPHASNQSLNVLHDRRQSVISEVSSVSPGPGPGPDTNRIQVRPSISSADESPRISEPKKSENSQIFPPDSAAINAARNDQSITGDVDQPPQPSESEPPPPGIDEPYLTPEEVGMKVGTAKGPQIAEKEDQRLSQEQEQYDHNQSRPFSFAGLEGGGEVNASQQTGQDLSQVSTHTLSPVSQTLSSQFFSKEMSRVSVEEVPDSANATGHRQSRSYSRPFGADTSVKNHPALKPSEPEQPVGGRGHMYSSENPLPSARRPQIECERPRQPRGQHHYDTTQQTQQAGEQEYRIPGPYVQEYRSPKQISTPKTARSQTQVQASGEPLPSTLRAQQYSAQASPQSQRPISTFYVAQDQVTSPSYQDQTGRALSPETHYHDEVKPQPIHQEQTVAPQRQSMGPPPVPAQLRQMNSPATDRPKKGVFASLFGSSNKSRSKLQKTDRDEFVDSRGGQHKGKRNSLFRRNSRHDSISSQQSTQDGGGHDYAGPLPPAKWESRELLNTPTPDQPSDTKKKRFSGLGNLFFKGGDSSRASTVPVPPTYNPPVSASGPLSSQPPPRTVASLQTYPAQQAFGYDDNGPARYYSAEPGPGHPARLVDSPLDVSRGQGPESLRMASPYQHQSRPTSYPYPTEESQYIQGQRQGLRMPHGNAEPRHRSDLRIDTGSSSHSPSGQPATAPAQIYPYPAQSVSSAAAGYDPSSSARPGIANTPPTGASAAGSPAVAGRRQQPQGHQDSRAHVFDLHKRSRSPRLGRKSSEDENLDAPQQQWQASASAPAPGSAGFVDQLGTFSSKKISPVGGFPRSDDDQERPYAIDIPGLDNDHDHDHGNGGGGGGGGCGDNDQDHNRRRNQMLRDRVEGAHYRGSSRPAAGRSETPVSVESGRDDDDNNNNNNNNNNNDNGGLLAAVSSMGNGSSLERNVSVLEGTPPVIGDLAQHRRSSARDVTSGGFIAELPGSGAEGYESEEEIPMSATAYPGQEWVPIVVGDGRWDD